MLKKRFKFFLKNGNIHVIIEFITMFILGLVEAKILANKKGSKQSIVSLGGPSDFKIIFALLAKEVEINV